MRFWEDNTPLVADAFANQLNAMQNLELEIIIVSKLQQENIGILCDCNVRENQRENIIELGKEEQFFVKLSFGLLLLDWCHGLTTESITNKFLWAL